MSKTPSLRRPLLALLCAAAFVSLQGCSNSGPAPETAPPPEDSTTRALAAEVDGSAEAARECSSGTVAMPRGAVGGRNQLHRQGEPNLLPVFSLKSDSKAWQTDCPVPMNAQRSSGSADCTARALLPEKFSLRITRDAAGDTYALELLPTDGSALPPLRRTLHPAYAPRPDQKHVTWLLGKADAQLDAELYVHLRDTSEDIAGARPHKHYVLEVFDADCSAHLPHLSTCKSEDFREGADCDAQMAKRGTDQVGGKQTDTGTGNEPPRR
jgi:hypothetical protein